MNPNAKRILAALCCAAAPFASFAEGSSAQMKPAGDGCCELASKGSPAASAKKDGCCELPAKGAPAASAKESCCDGPAPSAPKKATLQAVESAQPVELAQAVAAAPEPVEVVEAKLPLVAPDGETRKIKAGELEIFATFENDGRAPEDYEPEYTIEEIENLNARVQPFELLDKNGEPFSLDDLKGRVWVADFIFTRCAGPCPVLSAHMMLMRQALEGKTGAVDFVTISVDPEFDTPKVMARYAERFDAEAGSWKLLTGDYGVIARLANEDFAVGVSKHGGRHDIEDGIVLVDPIPETILHSRRMILVGADARVRGYYEGTRPTEIERLTRDILELAADLEESAPGE